MLWRACRGNVFLRQAMIESPLEDPANVIKINYNYTVNFINILLIIFVGRSSI